jgi:plastocyanin
MHPTGVASAASVFASAPNKVLFYVAGGLLACWAVVVAITGITHHDFPGSAGRARLVMLTSTVLVAATLTAAVVTGGGESEEVGAQDGAARSAGAAPTSGALELAADPTGRPLYDKDRAAVKAGKVEIRLANASSVPHNVTITRGTRTVAATKTIKSGSTTVTVSLAPGDYVFFCSVDAHRESGMEGALTAS